MNKIILKFVFLFTPLFERFGVDVRQLEIILQTKLIMDDRRPFAFAGRRQKQQTASKSSSIGAIIMLSLMGLFLIYFLFAGRLTIIGNSLYIAMFMILIALTLVSDFTSVLIDVRDNFIILPRPVNDRTVTVSKILHIAIHVFKLVIALTWPALIYEGFVNGAAGAVIFFIEIQLATVFSIFLVNLLYLAVLKFSTPQKFNSLISYFQIAFSLIIFASYQVLPRLSQLFDLNAIDPLNYSYCYVLPPVWFASFFHIIVQPGTFSLTELYLALAGVLMPFITIFIVLKFLAPGFNKRLASITPNGEEEVKVQSKKTGTNSPGLGEKLSSLLSNNSVEQAGFKLTWWLTSRYRDFIVKVYPSFAFIPAYIVYMIFLGPGRLRTQRHSFESVQNGSSYFFLIYSAAFVLITVLQQISQSEKYKAAWVMFSTSHNEPGKIISGMLQAVICKYVVPFYLLIAAVTLYIWGSAIINDLVLAFIMTLLYGIIISVFTIEYLPFSQPISNQGGRVFVRLLVMSAVFIVGFLHFMVSRWEWAVNAAIVAAFLVFLLAFRYFRNRNWEALEADYS